MVAFNVYFTFAVATLRLSYFGPKFLSESETRSAVSTVPVASWGGRSGKTVNVKRQVQAE